MWVSVLGGLVVALLVPGLCLGGSTLLLRRRSHSLTLYLERCLQQLGLHSSGSGAWRGTWRDRRVVAQLLPGPAPCLRLGTKVPTGALRLVARRSEPPWTDLLGDPGFDAAWCVRGPIVDRGILTGPVRLALTRVGSRIEIDKGWLIWNQERPDQLKLTDLQGALSTLAWVASVLYQAPVSPEMRLESLIRRDPVAGVRWRALAALARERPGSIERFARASLADGDPKVRWIASRQLGDADVLRELCLSREAAPSIRLAAARDLCALEGASSAQLEAAQGLCEVADPASLSLAVSLAVAAGRRGEACLIGLLDAVDAGVARSAVRGLGRIGAIEGVHAMRRRLGQVHTLSALHLELRGALGQVKRRLGDHVGALAVSQIAGGELSEIA